MSKELRPDTYAKNTLERYTGSNIEEFCSHIFLVNFPRYVDYFAEITGAKICSGYWTAAHDKKNDISIINFGVGSPSAGITVHCLSFLAEIKCVIFLGMCGGIDDEMQIGDFLIPTASVRDEGTSTHYLPKDVPAMPASWINEICAKVITKELKVNPKSGIMLTTDYRMWEFDNEFISYILKHRILAIDMETAAIFSVAYAMNLAAGAIILVSDLPLRKGGIKSKESSGKIFQNFMENHIVAGIRSVKEIKQSGYTAKPFEFDNGF